VANPQGLKNGYRIEMAFGVGAQEINNNRTWVTWEFRLVRGGGSMYSSGYQNPWSVTINGQTFSGTKNYNFLNGSTVLVLGSGGLWIAHNADGTGAVTYSGAFSDIAPADNVGDGVANGTMGLPQIARASTPSIVGGSHHFAGDTITINAERASTTFRHNVRWFLGGRSGYAINDFATTGTWQIPLDVIQEFPDASTGYGTLILDTYSSPGVLLGSKSIPFAVKTPDLDTTRPTFTSFTLQEGNAAITAAGVGGYVQTLSQLAYTLNGAAAKYGSTIKEWSISVDGVTAISSTNTGTSPALPTAGTRTVTARVKDGRGIWSTTRSLSITVLAYAKPVVTTSSLAVTRAASDGTIMEDGNYIRATLSTRVSSLMVGGVEKNTLAYTIKTNPTGSGTQTTKVTQAASAALATNGPSALVRTFGTYDPGSSFDVVLEVTDRFGSKASVVKSVSIATIFMHWAQNKGLGVGKFWTQGSVDAMGQMYQNNGKAVLDDATGTSFTATQFGSPTSGGTVEAFTGYRVGRMIFWNMRLGFTADIPHGGTGMFQVNAAYRPMGTAAIFPLSALGSGGSSGGASAMAAAVTTTGLIAAYSPGSRRAAELSGVWLIA